MQPHQLFYVVLLILPALINAGFNWGAGCEGGNGTFQVNLTKVGELVKIGKIPSGKWNVRIFLTAPSDVDVQIYDTDDVAKFPTEGKAVVAWCADAKTCNIGTLGSEEGAGYANYKNMRIGYSGYGGTGGKPGKEWISIEGVSTTNLMMKAYAFETGTAVITYSFDRVQTSKCLGLTPFTGTFTLFVPKNNVVDIGEIPPHKKNLQVNLYSTKDVDIQLYDIENKTKFAEGKAIIGYCEAPGCNKGLLGNNDGTAEFTFYKNRKYEYSGYYGKDGKKGNEYLRLSGISNTKLAMKAFGYASGDAIITYSYYEDYSSAGPIQPNVDFMYEVNHRDAFTLKYRNIPSNLLLVRRDSTFQFLISSPEYGVVAENVRIEISGWVGTSYRFGLETSSNKHGYLVKEPNQVMLSSENYEVETTQDGATRVSVRVKLLPNAPIGWYRLSTFVKVNDIDAVANKTKRIIEYTCNTTMAIIFNPYGKNDDVKQTKSNRDEYVENEKGLIWQGLSDDNTAHVWDFNQYDFNNLAISLDSLRRMNINERSDVSLVSRHLTYSVGQDICYGKWGEGSYTSGRPNGGYRCSTSNKKNCFEPGHWQGTTELFDVHRQVNGKSVQYCQCFVYSGVLTTIGRSLGIPTRTVTTFQSAHDTNADRGISKFYTIDDATGVFNPTAIPDGGGHDSIWSFHVWNEMYFKRPMLNAFLKCSKCADGWQAVDATPQELSVGGDKSLPPGGGYMMGPASLQMIKKNLDPICRNQSYKYGCFDSQFVISETNANIILYTKSATNTGDNNNFELYPKGCGTTYECGYKKDPFGDEFGTVGLQISTKKKGEISAKCLKSVNDDEPRDCTGDLDDITSKYKYKEASGPGKPTSVALTRRRSLNVGNVKLNLTLYNISVGMAPTASGPVINEPGHPASNVLIAITTNKGVAGNEAPTLSCGLVVSVRDYTSKVIAKVYEEKIVANNENNCIFQEVKRSEWLVYAATYLDIGNRNKNISVAMDPGERAYALHFEVTASTAKDGVVLLQERTKVICTPLIGAGSLQSRIFCDDNRGQWIRPTARSKSQTHLVHLDKSIRKTGCQNAGVTKSWASLGGPDDGVCQQSNNVNGCWDGGDCCTYSCFQLNGEFKELGDDGKWKFSHTCFQLNDTVDCIDPVFASSNFSASMNLQLLDYTRPSKPVYKEHDGQDNNQCDITVEIIKKYINTSISSPTFCESFSKHVCSNITFARTRIECSSEIAKLIPNTCNGGKMPRCKPRTSQNCQCQEEWSYTNTQSTVFQFKGHSCGNPFLGSGSNYHYNNWCNIVPGSCLNTPTGTPGDASTYYDGEQSPPSWWDNCGSGAADANTGKLLNAGDGPNMAWGESSKKLAIPIAYAGIDHTISMRVSSVINLDTITAAPAIDTTTGVAVTVGATTTAPVEIVTTSPASEVKVEASFELTTTQLLTATELKVPSMKLAIAKNIAYALDVPPESVTILDIYECPGDARCSLSRRMRRQLLQGVRIVIVFEVKGSATVAAKAEQGISNGNAFATTVQSSMETSIATNLGKRITIAVAEPTLTNKAAGTTTNLPVNNDSAKSKTGLGAILFQSILPLIAGIICLTCCIGVICYCCKNTEKRKTRWKKEQELKTYAVAMDK